MIEHQAMRRIGSIDGIAVPAWAHDLTPSVIDSRELHLASGADANIDLFAGPDAALVKVTLPLAADLAADAFQASVTETFTRALETLQRTACRHTVRMWSFVPGIHAPMVDGMDRYRVFNSGRYDAFARWFGAPGAFDRSLPAASAVGHDGAALTVCALGLKVPGVPVENPRQTPAFGYSRAHGPRPPCFVRAMLAELPTGTRLIVSGTASIRGEASIHECTLTRQVEETFENLQHLTRSVPGRDRYCLDGVETARVYFPNASDRASLSEMISARLPATAQIEYVPAWICRSELLVEIEATIAPAPAEDR